MPFDDLLEANAAYMEHHQPLASGKPRLGLAILTCVDTRVDPHEAFGVKVGDAKILRNAGARVTEDVLRTMVIAGYVLDVTRIAVVAHTDCGGTKADQTGMVEMVREATGEDASDMDFMTVKDQIATLREDVQRIRDCKYLAPGLEIESFMFDVHSGKLTHVE